MNTKTPVVSKRFKLEVDIESEEELTLEYVRSIAEAVLGSNESITAVRIFQVPAPKKSLPKS